MSIYNEATSDRGSDSENEDNESITIITYSLLPYCDIHLHMHLRESVLCGPPHLHSLAMHTILSASIVTSPRFAHGDFTPLLYTQRRALARLPLENLRFTNIAIRGRRQDINTMNAFLDGIRQVKVRISCRRA